MPLGTLRNINCTSELGKEFIRSIDSGVQKEIVVAPKLNINPSKIVNIFHDWTICFGFVQNTHHVILSSSDSM